VVKNYHKRNLFYKINRKLTITCLSCLFSLFLIHPFDAVAYFDFNSNCQSAMQAALDLRLKDARFLIEEETRLHPDNGYAIFLSHYTDAIELIVTEDEKIYKRLIDQYEDRMDQMDLLDDGSPDNKWLQAEILFQTGLAQVKFGTRISGASKLLSAYRKNKDHRKKHPDFWQNEKLSGIYNIILDFIPPFMRWAANMFGISGNADYGLNQLKHYSALALSTAGLAEEAVLITTLGYKLAWQEEAGVAFIAQQDNHILSNTLVIYLYATAARFTYRNELAMQLLAGIRQEDLQIEFHGLNYLMGRCKLNHLEPDANTYLQNYLDQYPGPDYKKDVCVRLSFYYLIMGDEKKSKEYRVMIREVGKDMRDPDQEAVLESKSTIVPHTGLLKARLLCDGGYFKESMEVLKSIDPGQLVEKSYRLEYHYRMGRVIQLSGYPDQAIPELIKTYNDGKSAPYTYATRAALQLGKIHEEMNNYSTASDWYKKCEDVFSSSHTTEGVKDMAAKGVKKLKGKF